MKCFVVYLGYGCSQDFSCFCSILLEMRILYIAMFSLWLWYLVCFIIYLICSLLFLTELGCKFCTPLHLPYIPKLCITNTCHLIRCSYIKKKLITMSAQISHLPFNLSKKLMVNNQHEFNHMFMEWLHFHHINWKLNWINTWHLFQTPMFLFKT